MKILRLEVNFYNTVNGNEPVRDWLRSLSKSERKAIGDGISIVQYGWPFGMPVVRKLEHDIWEIRTKSDKKTFRILATIVPAALFCCMGL